MTDGTDDMNIHLSTRKGPSVAAAVAKLLTAASGRSDRNDFGGVPNLVVIEGGMAGKRQEVEDDDFVAF